MRLHRYTPSTKRKLIMPDIGWPELIIILFVLMLLFGAKKLPDMARGTGRALRIFKAETKGLMDDDDDIKPTATGSTAATSVPPVQITQQPLAQAPAPAPEPQIVTPVEPLPPTHIEQDR
jgi:sec-independent protein translocase protein TatA